MLKSITVLLIFACGIFVITSPAISQTRIVIDSVTGLVDGEAIVNEPVRFLFRLEYMPGDGSAITSLQNGFRVWTERNGSHTNNYTPITYDSMAVGWSSMFDLGFWMNPYGVNGIGEDTIGFAGARIFLSGIPDGFSQHVWWIETTPTAADDTLCVDSSFFPPSGTWLWATDGPSGSISPGWGGPYRFPVVEPMNPCGDVNADGSVNILDLSYLIAYLYQGGPEPKCPWDTEK